MDAEELERFKTAVQQRVRGSVYVPPAPVQAPERAPQSDFTDCPSARALADMFPAAQHHALQDGASTELRIALDPLVVHRCETSMAELRALVEAADYTVTNETRAMLLLTSEHAFAAHVNVFVTRRGDACTVDKYVMYGRFQRKPT